MAKVQDVTPVPTTRKFQVELTDQEINRLKRFLDHAFKQAPAVSRDRYEDRNLALGLLASFLPGDPLDDLEEVDDALLFLFTDIKGPEDESF